MKNPLFLYCLIILTAALQSQTVTPEGQLSAWANINGQKFSDSQIGLRYIPSLFVEKHFKSGLSLDAELSVNAVSAAVFDEPDQFAEDASLKAYRVWLRFAGSQFEARGGLQKIDFGTATLLRSLRWFDSIDPRDPLQITNGVYALLGRYFFLNNANIWVWGLYGNEESKGSEVFATADNTVEFGGRIQHPIGSGELAFSYHRRKFDLNKNLFNIPICEGPFTPAICENSIIPENRFALDGKWDLQIGLWFETALIQQGLTFLNLLFKYQNFLTLGADYTFPWGNGLYVMAEHLVVSQGNKLSKLRETVNFSAWSAFYNIGLLDRVSAIVYYDWSQKQVFRFASFSRFYDKWSFYLNVFWNPEDAGFGFAGLRRDSENTFGIGKGLQIMAVYNH